MSQFSAQTLNVAREALIQATEHRLELLGQIEEQNCRITELQRELEKQTSARTLVEDEVSELRREIASLRSEMPDDAFVTAYGELHEYVVALAERSPELRLAA